MAIFTNGIFPAGGEAGDGGGIIQVRNFHRSGPLSYSNNNSSNTYNTLLYSEITPRNNSNKILIFASIDGVANRGNSEWEAWIGYNATAPNGTTITASDQSVGGWTNLAPITGLGAWGSNDQTIGTYSAHILHAPATTSVCRYEIITNRRSAIFVNNEWNTSPDAGGSDQGTSLILMEVAS